MPRARTPRTPKPKAEKIAKKAVKALELVASGNGNGNGHATVDRESEIRLRAYQLYEGRGYGDGMADQDWFQAEREVLGRHA
jgi:hypothetical protein